MANGGEVTAIIGADISGYERGMQQVSGSSQSAFENVNKFASNVGKGMMVAGAATTAMGVTALKGFGSFEQSLNTAAVVAGGTSKDIGGLAYVANRMGAELPLSAKDAADAMVNMARDGASIDSIKEEFPAIAKAATAAGSDLQATASVVQQSMNLWGDSLKSPAQAAAILTTTANVSNASVEEMQQVLADVGSTATSVGYSMQDVSTAVGLLSNKGIPAAQAAQNLNFAMTKMIKPTASASGMMEELGITYYDSAGKMKPINEIAGELAQSMSGLTDEQKQNALSVMFGQAGYKVMNDLMESVTDTTGSATTSWSGMSDAINGASSSTEAANKVLDNQASEMQKNVGAKIEQVGGNWESLTNKSMEAQSGVSSSLLDMTNSALNWATESKSPFAEMTRNFIGLSPVIGPATTAVGGFLTSLGKITGVAKGAIKLIGSLGKSIFKLGGKLLSLATGNTAVATTSAPAAAGEKAVGKSAKGSAKDMMALGLSILEIGAGIGLATAGFASLVYSITQLSKQGVQGVATLTAVTVAISALVGVFALLGPALTANALGIGVFGASILAIGGGIDLATSGIANLINSFSNFIEVLDRTDVSSQKIIKTFTAIGVGFASMIAGFAITLGEKAPAISNAFMQLVMGMLNNLITNAPQIVTAFTNVLLAFMQSIADNSPRIIAGFASMLGQLSQSILEITPYVFQLFSAMMVGAAAEITVMIPAFHTLGGEIGKAIVDGLTGQKYTLSEKSKDILNSSGQEASKAGTKSFNDAGGKSAIAGLNAIAAKNGDAKSRGAGLGSNAASGVKSKTGEAHKAGKNVGDNVSSGVSSVHLGSAGEAIMSGFLGGLRSGFGPVQGFVTGIASWIKAHKGPISYDRKLLIPAGKAIMGGFNNSLNSNFVTVKKSVMSYADQLSGVMDSVSFAGAIQQVDSLKDKIDANIQTAGINVAGMNMDYANNMSQDVVNAPSAEINLTIEQNWDGDMVRYSNANKDARNQARINLITKR